MVHDDWGKRLAKEDQDMQIAEMTLHFYGRPTLDGSKFARVVKHRNQREKVARSNSVFDSSVFGRRCANCVMRSFENDPRKFFSEDVFLTL